MKLQFKHQKFQADAAKANCINRFHLKHSGVYFLLGSNEQTDDKIIDYMKVILGILGHNAFVPMDGDKEKQRFWLQ